MRISRIFLWGSPYGPVAWSTICCPKEEGGLGVRDLNAWNSALMTKLIWNLHLKKDSMWIKWVHHFYIKRDSVWDWKAPKEASPIMKYLMNVRERLVEKLGTMEEVIFLERLWGSKGVGVHL